MNIKLKLVRDDCDAVTSLGKMYADDVYVCETLEDRDRKLELNPDAKIKGETAIPRGTYNVIVDWSNKFHRMLPHVMDVPGFDYIRIHPGNAPDDTEGCVLVGMSRGPNYIYRSVNAFNLLMPMIEAALDSGGDVTLEVV